MSDDQLAAIASQRAQMHGLWRGRHAVRAGRRRLHAASIWPAADDKSAAARLGKPLFVQISDTHIGFNKDANPDVNGTLTQTIDS